MNTGFTGTQEGMVVKQLMRVTQLLTAAFENEGDEFHHGDCIGADEQAAAIADEIGFVIVAHPPKDESKRAFYEPKSNRPHRVCEPEEYLIRNHNIVKACLLLIAAPLTLAEQLRSGTWATIRFAVKQSRRILIAWPDGRYQAWEGA